MALAFGSGGGGAMLTPRFVQQVLKTSLGYDQRTLNTLAFFKDLGYNVGILAGLINEVTPPWVGLSIGAALNLFGYLMIYLAIDGRIARPPVWLMCIYICVGANSQSFTNTCALVTCVKNFPESRGIVLGLLKSFTGLSGAIFAQLDLAIYGDDAKSLVLLIAWLPVLVSFLFLHTVRIMPYPRLSCHGSGSGSSSIKTTKSAFFRFLYISIALAGFLLVMIVVQQRTTISHAAYAVSGAAVLLLLFLPLTVVLKQEYMILKEHEESLREPPVLTVEEQASMEMIEPEQSATIETDADAPQQQQQLPSSSSSLGSCLKRMFTPPARGEDYTILQALVSIDMLLLFLATICGAGGTLTAIDNMGQIGQSLGYPANTINTFVSLISIWNYAGRVTSGFTPEIFLSRYRFPRTLMVTMVLLLSSVGHLLIAFGVLQSLYLASVLVGFCFGALWPLVYTIISKVFGLKYYSTLYNFGTVSSPIGATCSTCASPVLGMTVSLVLVWRTRNFYKGDIYARFRDTASAKVLPAGDSVATEEQPRKEAAAE
ncbi:hypothetical protein BAE44_0015714 [Dichanthelium oligosanthes]|uniref:Uncharacterized protein n=1 Tax=Dichanthelium oligosanthes TaxID=888268 RepID=A0A1E5VDX3_9POAL|nr:hypothetical protein BAE44_0015714 [Dichanthelium oligosanthes]